MTNRSKDKGTSWESAIVRFLQDHGHPHAERRALNGTHDRGDISGVPGVVIEAKNEVRIQLSVWLREALEEKKNANADLAFVWAKRKGKTSPGDAYVVMDGYTLLHLMKEAGY